MVDAGQAGEGSAEAGGRGEEFEPTIIEPEPIDCTKTENVLRGWTQLVGANSVLIWNERAVVELEYAITLDDSLRDEENLFRYVVADRFQDFERVLPPDYNQFGWERDFMYGWATVVDTGSRVFIGYKPVTYNGVTRPVLGITETAEDFWALFPDSHALTAMHDYNAFPLRCAKVIDSWTTSSAFAFDTWAYNGVYTGLVVSSSNLDLYLLANGRYVRDATVYTNTQVDNQVFQGTFEFADRELILHRDDGKVSAYDAAFVAVRGGLLLYVANREYTGETYQFVRRRD